MPLLHKFQQYDFQNGFQSRNSILEAVPYDPEVIFIGTYNHGWAWNKSDFYYGRGMYMWPVMANLFLHNQNFQISQRTLKQNVPSHKELFEICKIGKVVFADIVKGIKDEISVTENVLERCVVVNNEYDWCSRKIKGRRVGEYSDIHLENIANHGWLDDNVKAIIEYINKTPSIKHIYFTFKSGSWLVDRLNEICAGVRQYVAYCSIFTPTANGFAKNMLHPYSERAWGLAHCWVWNNLSNQYPIERPGFGNLNHDWLIDKSVNPNKV